MPIDKIVSRPRPEISVFAPWPLFTITIERLAKDHDEVYFHSGGQAVWVARMIGGLGGRPTIVGPFGGETRTVLEAMIAQEGVNLRSVPVRGSNGGYINDRRSGDREEIASVPPPHLDRHEVDDLYNAALSEGLKSGTMVITGIPDGQVMPVETYDRLVKDLSANDVNLIADVAGTVLEAIESGLTTLKVSHEELMDCGYAADEGDEALIGAMKRMREKAKNIVVSRAGAGCLALMDDVLLEAKGPTLQALDPTGAGDSMTAALAYACAAGLDPKDTLRLATAAGALNVTRHGRGTGRAEDMQSLADRVEVETYRGNV